MNVVGAKAVSGDNTVKMADKQQLVESHAMVTASHSQTSVDHTHHQLQQQSTSG